MDLSARTLRDAVLPYLEPYPLLRRLMNARKPPNWETLSFSDKIAWQCDNPDPAIDYAAMADKHRVKEIVRDKFLVPATFLYARAPEEIDAQALPATYVMKAAHGWNMSLLVEDRIALGDNHKRDDSGQRADTRYLREVAHSWLSSEAEHDRRRVERQYLFVKPGIMIEELLKPVDYELKLLLFRGRMRFAQVFYQGFEHSDFRYRHFDENWTEIEPDEDVRPHYELNGGDIAIPSEEMLSNLFALCSGIDHVRADFYHCRGRYYFSEFTFTHNGLGGPGFIGSLDKALGAFWLR